MISKSKSRQSLSSLSFAWTLKLFGPVLFIINREEFALVESVLAPEPESLVNDIFIILHVFV